MNGIKEQSLVVLVEPKGAQNHAHAEALTRAGFRVASIGADGVDVARVLEQCPAVVAAEVDGAGSATLNLARRFRQTPHVSFRSSSTDTNCSLGILKRLHAQAPYGCNLSLDGTRLVAAVRGLIAASRKDNL